MTTTYHYNNGMLLSETTGDETLRYYYDSTGKVASIVYKKGDGEETGYFYARNAQGDIIAVYRSKDSKLMGTYEYDLWGRLISVNATAEDTDNITNKNPYRYRGYYYDKETGFYYLTARYYDPQIRRFISADSMNALMIATTDVTCKNLFVYAENNPVTNKDSSGNFVDMVFDVISLAGSIADVIKKPNDPLAWACLAGDAADVLIPGVSGIGEVIKGAKAVAIVAETAKVASGAGAVAEGAIKAKKAIGNLVDGAKSLGKKVKNGSKNLVESAPNEIANMTRKELQDKLPKGWDFQNHNGRVHIKDTNGNFRVRIDPPDKKTDYTHIHINDENKNPLDIHGNIVSPKDPAGHIPYNY